MQGVTVKMSQEDLDTIKKAMQKQKGAGGGEEAGFIEVSSSQWDVVVLETQGLVLYSKVSVQSAQLSMLCPILMHTTRFICPAQTHF